jgi:DNA invertase Pin-like site-specific DNA recombinase
MGESYQWSNNSPSFGAIAYYRHSAEDKQENSVPIQRELTRKFASENNLRIIHEEADEGKTGLLANRPGFNRLFKNWIYNKEALSFKYVLVYDVSRWGRFQDQDEAGYYEFLCKKHGKKVIYVSRGFPKKEEELMSALQTSIERYMAAEYSRQLSDKVFHGSVRVSRDGYSAGGKACYGLGRLLLDDRNKPIRILKHGEHKQISNERVTFVPLNNHETEVVQKIFDLFVHHNLSPAEITRHLNQQGALSATGDSWDRAKVVRILSNEAYAGTRIYNKTWNRLKKGKRRNPRSDWVICLNAFPAVIDKNTFARAQEKLYWYTLKQWRVGIRALQQARRIVQGRIAEIIEQRGIINHYLSILVDHFPLVLSVGIPIQKNHLQWCFILPEQARHYSEVLAIGVRTSPLKPIESVFAIPSAEFSVGGMYIISTQDKSYHNWLVRDTQLDTTITNVLKNVVNATATPETGLLFARS